jgi:ketosteroid isomerase-like protein
MKTSLGLLLVTVGFLGCASPRQNRNIDNETSQAQIRQRIMDILDAAQKKDMPRLDSYHLYGPAFTKFSGQTGRQDAALARKGEHDGLGAANGLSMRADDLRIDVFEDTAIATFILDFSFKAGADTISKQERTTLVFVRDQGSWKIVHEHLSPLGPPAAVK